MVQRGRDTRYLDETFGGDGMSIILSLFLILGPIAIVYLGVKALQHTIIIRNEKKRAKMSSALMASMLNINGPLRRYNLK